MILLQIILNLSIISIAVYEERNNYLFCSLLGMLLCSTPKDHSKNFVFIREALGKQTLYVSDE